MAQFVTQTQQVNAPTVQTTTSALASNQFRQGWQIQNQDTNPLRVCLGSTASSTVYHMTLKACGMAGDGTGGSFSELDGTVYTGAVTVYSAGTPSYTILEH